MQTPTPEVEEIVKQMPPSYTIRSHEENPYESTYIDIDDVRRVLSRFITSLTQKHQEEIEKARGEERNRMYHELERLVANLTAPTKTDKQ